MISTKTYDLIKKLLQDCPVFRNNDKELVWAVWVEQKVAQKGYMTKEQFLANAGGIETITRARRKIQELYPELRATALVQKMRRNRQGEKGTHVYRDRIPVFNNKDNTVSFI